MRWRAVAVGVAALSLCAALVGLGGTATPVDDGPVRDTAVIALHGDTSNPGDLRTRLAERT